MSTFVPVLGQVYINPDHIQSIRAYAEKPRFSDVRNCEFFVPTFKTRSVLALSNRQRTFI